ISAHTSRHGTTCSISSRNTCRRVFFVYRSKPFIVARLLCCLFVELIWRSLLYIPVERGDLIQSLPRGWKAGGGLNGSTTTVWDTPATFRASALSTVLILPPSTGGCSIEAYNMPSR